MEKKISVFGLGYVGCTIAACFASAGYTVIGVDINEEKVRLVNAGKSPIQEKDIGGLIERGVREGRIIATTSVSEGMKVDVSMLAVGTPSRVDGSVDLTAMNQLLGEVSGELSKKKKYHLFVVRSTVPPGTTRKWLNDCARLSGKKAGVDFGGCMNPEFMRESSSVEDFYDPPFTVIGEFDEKSGALLEGVYNSLNLSNGKVHRISLESAEIFKYFNNGFHALKITFANEVGRLCKSLGVDSREIMRIFCEDNKLNLSAYYLRPGFAFGGSCLPKDVRGVRAIAASHNVSIPVLDAIMKSNEAHVKQGVDEVKKCGGSKIGLVGITFKRGTDDLRESPFLELFERLLKVGKDVHFYDQDIVFDQLIGANQRFVTGRISDFPKRQMQSIEEVVEWSDCVVLCNSARDYAEEVQACKTAKEKIVLDLSGASRIVLPKYRGLLW